MTKSQNGAGCGCGGGGCNGQTDPSQVAAYREETERLRVGEFVLASLLTSYPKANLGGQITSIAQSVSSKLSGGATFQCWNAVSDILKNWMSPDLVEDLESEYINLFDRGKSRNSLHESEYGPGRVTSKQNTLADLAGFYKAFRLEALTNEENREMVDHVAVELEFYGILLTKEAWAKANNDNVGVETISMTRSAFIQEHLGRFVGSIAEAAEVRKSAVYGPVFAWITELIEAEAKELGIKLSYLKMTEPSNESEKIGCCGSCS
jgi:nitrate reductase assembly molybdenum cofactor insertion protein NarJ